MGKSWFFCVSDSNSTTPGASADHGDVAMILTKDKKVGIGTTSPSSKLEVVGSGSSEGLVTFSADHDISMRLKCTHSGKGEVYYEIIPGPASGGTNSWKLGTNDDEHLHFGWGALGSMNSNEKMTILNTGNVGIGTDSPLGTLHIQVPEQYENGLFISSSHGTYGSDSDGGVYHFNHYNHATSTRRGLLMQERNTTGVFKTQYYDISKGYRY